MLELLPLLGVLALVAPVLLSPVSRRADLLVSRVALSVFGFYVANESPRRTRQQELLRAAYVGRTHRAYAARTLLIAGLSGVAGSVVGVYVAAEALALLSVNRSAVVAALPARLAFLAGLTNLQQATLAELFVLLLFSSATVGAALALGAYWARWQYLEQKADARARKISATLPRTVAFIYALSRSGMPFPEVMDTLTRNRRVYGEAAREVGISVREMNTFGTNALTALRRMAGRTPSDELDEFGENLASVLGSGRSLSQFLHEQYEQYQEEAEAQQEQYLALLSTFAEVYVTVFVAGPLFFITVLVIAGLVIRDTITLTRVIGYLALPLASLGFVRYIDGMTRTIRTPADELPAREQRRTTAATGASTAYEAAADGGVAAAADSAAQQRNRERLAAYDRFAPIRAWIDHPVASLRRTPSATFFVTVPVGLAWIATRVERVPREPLALLEAVDTPLLEATLLVLGAFALVYELKKRRTRAVENSVPDLLDRMASINEAGMTIVESIERVSRTDLGALTPEIRRTWRDIEWGADARTALWGLDRRTDSLAITRTVTLITNAMRASGDVAPVLRIAADEAYETRRLRRERRQEMVTYLLVIYIAFLVFLGIIAALALAFIPAVEQAGVGTGVERSVGQGVSTGVFSGIGGVDAGSYELVFFHIAAIQAVCSGLIAGQLGEGDVYDGFKHATILLLLAYLTFVAL